MCIEVSGSCHLGMPIRRYSLSQTGFIYITELSSLRTTTLTLSPALDGLGRFQKKKDPVDAETFDS
jgi:hypothetical protein